MIRRTLGCSFMLVGSLFLASCGGGAVGYSTTGVLYLDSDVLKGVSATSPTCSTDTGGSILPDDVTISVTTLAQTTPTTIIIDSAVVTYAPADGVSPALPPQNVVINQQIASGATVGIPVRVASQLLKGSATLSVLQCSGAMFSYYATIHFNAHDLNTGDSVNITDAQVNIKFANFVG
jgi:hypothetical protein